MQYLRLAQGSKAAEGVAVDREGRCGSGLDPSLGR